MLQCGVFHRLQCEWVCAPQAAVEHICHHGPLHVLHGNTYSGAWSTSLPLSLTLLLPVLFLTPLPVHCFCTFLNMLPQQHHEPDSCAPLESGVGLWQSWAEPGTGKPQQFLTVSLTLQPSPVTKTLPCKPKNQGCQLWRYHTWGFLGFRDGLQTLEESKKLFLMENFSGRISFQCWAST